MRVALRELKAVRRGDMLARYAPLGPVTFVHAEFPNGLEGTDLARPCCQEHWGLTLQGDLTVHGEGARRLRAGAAWHVPAGPEHTFTSEGRVVVAGFAPIREAWDDSAPALERLGLEPVPGPRVPSRLPVEFTPIDGKRQDLDQGAIHVAAAVQGLWVCMRAAFGPRSGYASGWCDLPHWGVVLDGDLILRHEREVELLGPGDVYYCPAGPPGHQFEVADSATILDYTPLDDLVGRTGRRSSWRDIVAKAGLARSRSGPGRTDHPPADVGRHARRPAATGRDGE